MGSRASVRRPRARRLKAAAFSSQAWSGSLRFDDRRLHGESKNDAIAPRSEPIAPSFLLAVCLIAAPDAVVKNLVTRFLMPSGQTSVGDGLIQRLQTRQRVRLVRRVLAQVIKQTTMSGLERLSSLGFATESQSIPAPADARPAVAAPEAAPANRRQVVPVWRSGPVTGGR